MAEVHRGSWPAVALGVWLLALPALGVHAWMAWTFPSYRGVHVGQDVVFTFAWCSLLVLVVHRRLLHVASVPVAIAAYVTWLFLVISEGVSYYLQADTFNARFFGNLDLANLGAGLRAYPAMIGGGLALLGVMVVACALLLARVRRGGRRAATGIRSGPTIVALAILVLVVCGVDSTPRRLAGYLTRAQRTAGFADTPAGRTVARQLDLHPVSREQLVAAPGKNLVFIYLESLESIYWDPEVFPGLTPNLDRLRKEGLDFPGFESFSGTTFTIAGMFASQCGAPMYSSPFAGLDAVAGNSTDDVTFHPQLVCLGDVLHKAGYAQVYLAGAPITFSNKGLFYRLHGYDEALGLKELEAAAGGELPESGWGVFDGTLFRLLLQRYRELEAAGKPFNLTTITLDTHPPDGRPSPGCPTYAANPNSMLQAVHCSDYLVGKFVDALEREPDWDNTIVVVMSDHLMMRNDAEPLYPKDYHRRPALLVLNAGKGVRPGLMYHMDVAPTVLGLMGVRTNTTFIAGADRSQANAAGSKLVDDAVTNSVLRKALWAPDSEFRLCGNDTLLGWRPDGAFDVGGRKLAISEAGKTGVGIRDGEVIDIYVDDTNAKLVISPLRDETRLLASRGDSSALMIRSLHPEQRRGGLFSVDWLGRNGAIAHLADVPRLQGLTLTSPDCKALVTQADAAPAGTALDFSSRFDADTAEPPSLPPAPREVRFDSAGSAAFERGLGWLPPQPWGSWAVGNEAALGFRLPEGACRGGKLRMRVDPYLPPSRPKLDVEVWVNGKLATTWHFAASPESGALGAASDQHSDVDVAVPLAREDSCVVNVDLRFSRRGATPPPYPEVEDSRPLQMALKRLSLVPGRQ